MMPMRRRRHRLHRPVMLMCDQAPFSQHAATLYAMQVPSLWGFISRISPAVVFYMILLCVQARISAAFIWYKNHHHHHGHQHRLVGTLPGTITLSSSSRSSIDHKAYNFATIMSRKIFLSFLILNIQIRYIDCFDVYCIACEAPLVLVFPSDWLLPISSVPSLSLARDLFSFPIVFQLMWIYSNDPSTNRNIAHRKYN